MNTTKTTAKTRDDWLYEAAYGHEYNLRNERLYRRFDAVTNAVQIFGGSGAAFAAMSDKPVMVAAMGLLLSAAATLALVMQPAVKHTLHRQLRSRYLHLLNQGDELTLEQLRQRCAEISSDPQDGFAALEHAATNDALDTLGDHDAPRLELTRFERLMAAIT
jgi:hypothetical protein